MTRLLRAPALHFLVLGGLLFIAKSDPGGLLQAATASVTRPRAVVGAAQLAQIRREIATRTGRPASAVEERATVARAVDEEILYREALARGLDRDNRVVRDRVVRSMRLLTDEPGASEATLYDEGIRLGLDRSDLVIRRHLVATMRLLVVAPVRLDAPSDAELAEVLEREAERFRLPAATSFTHVFVGAGHVPAHARTVAHRLLEEIRAENLSPADAVTRGNPFPLAFRLDQRTDADLDRLFGAGFAAGIGAIPVRQWGGPVASSYGYHLVWVEGRRAEHLPTLASVRTRVVERAYSIRSTNRLREWLAAQRARYDVQVAEERPDAAIALRPATLPADALPLARPAPATGVEPTVSRPTVHEGLASDAMQGSRRE